MDNIELLRALSDQFGVSSFEGEIRDWIYANIKDRVDDVKIGVSAPCRSFVILSTESSQ